MVFQNLFIDNTIPDFIAEERNNVVYIHHSQVRVYSNRFVNNTAPSIVTINQWENYPFDKINNRIILFSNVIADNTVTGPIVHLVQGEQFQFINNTVANNILNTTNSNLQAIIGLGRRTETSASFSTHVASTHKFDMHNNLFFANRTADNLATNMKLFTEVNNVFSGFNCTSLISNNGNYARFNWVISTGAYLTGECSNNTFGTVATPLNGNVFTVLPSLSTAEISTFYTANFFTSANDPGHPYRLRPDASYGIDPNITMDSLVVTGVAATTSLTGIGDTFARDPRNEFRFIHQIPPPPQEKIDVGAYELGEPAPIQFFDNTGGAYSNYSAGNFTYTFNEDGTAVIDMIRMVQFGFKPYTVEIVPNVTIYDTNPVNACSGLPYLYNPETYQLTYCPPPDFHNQGVSAPEANISFQYRVTGLFSTGTIPSPTTYATVTVKINAVNDGTVTVATQKAATDLVTTIQVPLQPRVTFTPFGLPDASGNDNKDYPFTYSLFTETSDPQNLLDGPNLPSMISNGVFTYTPPPRRDTRYI